MSYDLYLKPRLGEFDAAPVKRWLAARPGYEVGDTQATYQNPETGVYFSYYFADADGDDGDDDRDGGAWPLALNVNYYRPAYFAREVEPELAALVSAFDLVVDDPQSNGMGRGDFDATAFLRGWDHGNAFAHAALQRHEGVEAPLTLPTAVLERTWRWNHTRNGLQDELGDDVFVPRIMLVLVDGQAGTALVWGDAIPIAAVEVDWLIVPRKALAPRRFFFRRADMTLLRWREALPMLEQHGRRRADGALVLDYVDPPPAMRDWIAGLPAMRSDLKILPLDAVLDRELVEAARLASQDGGGG